MIWTNHNYIDHLAEDLGSCDHSPRVPQGRNGKATWQVSGEWASGASTSGIGIQTDLGRIFDAFSHATTFSDRSRAIMEAL